MGLGRKLSHSSFGLVQILYFNDECNQIQVDACSKLEITSPIAAIAPRISERLEVHFNYEPLTFPSAVGMNLDSATLASSKLRRPGIRYSRR
ncbi:hypothetical protein AJ79_09938 [Helicocarpus griseus UAMH5409]|uniref:Uncharacterized protein n=1 Tax=Helicocarpus griseus UAMH5409 TaxID=1447875 RepID=A0A2B7WGJ1_9EURO|nr:hypothetical protein AJ79_09938 [Helicocarpus griseus UAMH5409]